MRYSLEVRSPLLDYRMAEFGASLTTAARTQNGLKSPLKMLLEKYIPRKLFDRPKKGFSVPMRHWITGPMRDLVHDTLSQQVLRESGWLNLNMIDRLLKDLNAGKPEVRDPLWMLLVLGQSYVQHKSKSHSASIVADRTTSTAAETPISHRLEGAA